MTFDRALSRKLPGVQLLDGSSSLLRHLFDVSDSYAFKGQVAAANLSATLCAELAWNDNLGRCIHQRFVAVQAEALNPAAFADFLLHPAVDALHTSPALPMDALMAALQRRLAQEASETVQPGSLHITGVSLG